MVTVIRIKPLTPVFRDAIIIVAFNIITYELLKFLDTITVDKVVIPKYSHINI